MCESMESGFSKEEAMEQMDQWEDECVEKYGFYVHYVNEGESIDVHTHGLAESLNHPDLQILLSLDPQTSHHIINGVVDRIREGESFSDGMVVEGLIKNFPVKFIDAKEGNRDILRIILPDPNGKLDLDEIDEKYAIQYGIEKKWDAYKPEDK